MDTIIPIISYTHLSVGPSVGLSVGPSVGPSVRRSVGPPVTSFFSASGNDSRLMPGRVSGLVYPILPLLEGAVLAEKPFLHQSLILKEGISSNYNSKCQSA